MSKGQRYYEDYVNNNPVMHSNRFPSWQELSREQKDQWEFQAHNSWRSKVVEK